MRAEISETTIEVWPGQTSTVTVHVFNTAEVICGYEFEVLGVDREWVRLDYERLNLFPDDDGEVQLTFSLPHDFPAGRREIALVVRSALDPLDQKVLDLELDIEANLEARLTLEPTSLLSSRKRGTFGMVIQNTGNGWAHLVPSAEDDEGKAKIVIDPPEVDLAPGGETTVRAQVSRRRPFMGSSENRMLTFRVDGVETPPEAVGSFTQQAMIGRGLLSLMGLLAALAVFGLVLINSLGDVLDRTTATDAALASRLDEQQRQLNEAAANPSSMSGTVRVDTASGPTPLGNVTVQLFSADDGSKPLGVVATGENGMFTFEPIIAGDYKLQVVGAGFDESWYPAALTFEEAETISVEKGTPRDGLDLNFAGRTSTVSGSVLAADPSEVVVSLIQLKDGVRIATAREVTTDGTGVFVLENVPLNLAEDGTLQPYELVAAKEGFAEDHRLVTIAEGEVRDDIRIRLREGDARISGMITLGTKPPASKELVEVTVTVGGQEFKTVTFDSGRFVFRGLPSPALYSVTATRPGYSTETRTLRMESGGAVSGLDFDLSLNTRVISGKVTSGGEPISGVLIAVSDGQTTTQTKTDVLGEYELRGLSRQSSYTLSAADPRYQDITLSCPPAATGCSSEIGTDIDLKPATLSVLGVVCLRRADPNGGAARLFPVGGVTVDLAADSFTASTLSVDTASPKTTLDGDPYASAECKISAADRSAGRYTGFYRINNVPVGTYTITFTQPGGLPFTQVISVPTNAPINQTLVDTSSVTVEVVDKAGARVSGAIVEIHTQSAYASDPQGTPRDKKTTTATGEIKFVELATPEDYVVIVRYQPPGDLEQTYSRSFPLRAGESKKETVEVRK